MSKVERKGALSSDVLRDFLREMVLIRRFEEKVEERFRAGELPGFLHVAIGQEACAVGVCRALEDGDVIASTHRAHGHTLAKGTRQTIAKLEEPITLRLYYSSRLGERVPAFGTYAARVRELLDQYVAAAKGKLRLETYDPVPFSDAEDRAVAYGLQAVPLNDQGEAVYFGLAGTNSTDDQQTVAFFNPERERFLEYDLTRLVHALAFPKRTIVGVMSPLPIDVDLMAAGHGRAGEPMPIIDQLRQVDDVQSVPLTAETIPANIDVLLLVHP